ncbi:hypothetical protein [Streptomyces sp. SID8499]|uniref:hypothetical protein n=1 Tax=Streptomyces sp. SID8499 TaxID=2706106 RepID=UPI0013C66196|nr:hypothetical protein [Streptomyces sp. SID8499]NED32242.1 hypothetical protein [Streptomyces sp. SID8499]
MVWELSELSWSTFFQRLLLFIIVGALVLVLIGVGVDASLALTIVGTVVLITKDLWGGGGNGRPPASGAEADPGGGVQS